MLKKSVLSFMETYLSALDRIIGAAKPLQTEKIRLTECYLRGLAENIEYDVPMPPFHKSAMDGYACAREDLDRPLLIVDTIYAGKEPTIRLQRGQCVKIMTGAAVPENADTVFMVEHSEMMGEKMVKCTNPNTKSNICYQGEDVEKGEIIVHANTFLDQRHMPLLAGAGYNEVEVYRQPKVEIIATGTELIEPGEPLPPYKIRNSNSYQVLGQLKSLGIKGTYNGIVKDEIEGISNHIKKALQTTDVLILSGGVSVGDYDYVPQLLEQEGLDLVINGTAIQPGKPMVFAHKNGKYVFGLSGNPVSSFVQFELYVRHFLLALMGCPHKPKRFQMPLAHDFERKKDNRLQFIPANISDENTVIPVPFHGSAHINALCLAQYLMEIPVGIKTVKKGEMVYLRDL